MSYWVATFNAETQKRKPASRKLRPPATRSFAQMDRPGGLSYGFLCVILCVFESLR